MCLARWHSHERRGKDTFGSSEKSGSIGFEDDEGGNRLMQRNAKEIGYSIKLIRKELGLTMEEFGKSLIRMPIKAMFQNGRKALAYQIIVG